MCRHIAEVCQSSEFKHGMVEMRQDSDEIANGFVYGTTQKSQDTIPVLLPGLCPLSARSENGTLPLDTHSIQ